MQVQSTMLLASNMAMGIPGGPTDMIHICQLAAQEKSSREVFAGLAHFSL
jgi:hypothetical protein